MFCSVFLLLVVSLSYFHLSFLAPSIHFLLSPSVFYTLSFFFFLSALYSMSHSWRLSFPCCVSGSFSQSSQEAVVWDIPVFTMIDHALSSFVGVMFSCKITQGSFFLSGSQFIDDIYSGMTFSGFVSQRYTEHYFSLQGNLTIIAA